MNEEEINEKKRIRPRIGSYRITEESFLSRRYVYLPSAYLKSPMFSMEEVFEMLGIPMPNILFRVFQASRPRDWNVRLPQSREHLAQLMKTFSASKAEGSEDYPGPVLHYHGVLRENCKRLLLGTGLACQKAGAGFRITESWNPEVSEDAVAGWVTDDNKANVVAIGAAAYQHFHPKIWEQLETGMTFAAEGDQEGAQLFSGTRDVIIDPEPFYNNEYEITRDAKTNRLKGSFPHPNMSHLLVSDNLELLEKKLSDAVPWGLIMVNGSVVAADYFTQAIQHGLPVIMFRHTGFTTDIAVQAYRNAKKLIQQKKHDPHALAERAFPEDLTAGRHITPWLKPFDEDHVSDCQQLNILLENWPSKFNEDSIFVVDMFSTTEDELQDKLTQTMGVVFAPQHEVGGHMSESKRLTFAWRTRAKYVSAIVITCHIFVAFHVFLLLSNYMYISCWQLQLLNSRNYKFKSDVLEALLVIFTFLSTVSAVVYTFFFYNEHFELRGSRSLILASMLKANLLLPLVATFLRGIISVFNPTVKYIALKNAAVKVEAEIYEYRTKVGKYSFRKPPAPSKDQKTKKKDRVTVAEPVLPRIAFAKALDRILDDLKASDVQHGSMKELPKDFDPLSDITKRIKSNRGIQNSFSKPMVSAADASRTKKENPFSHLLDIEAPPPIRQRTVTGVLNSSTGEYNNWHTNAKIKPERESEKEKSEINVDDGLSMLTADDYLSYRMLPMIAELSTKTPRLSAWSSTFTILVLILSVSAAALSTFERSDFIPAALAFSGGITAWASYQQTDLRLILTNNSLCQLNQLLVWWDGLTMIEKRIPINKETLVKTSEMAILSQATVVGGSQAGPDTTSASNKEDDDDNMDN